MSEMDATVTLSLADYDRTRITIADLKKEKAHFSSMLKVVYDTNLDELKIKFDQIEESRHRSELHRLMVEGKL